MDINTQKEQFSYAYIYAVAATAGYSFQIAPRPLDLDGIDIILAGNSSFGTFRYPRLELQVKCTSSNVVGDDAIKYPLGIKNYNELRAETVITPRLLVVVVVPDVPDNWLTQSQQELCMKYCGYWVSLNGQPPTQNQTTITVSISRQNIFNVEALKTIMQRISAGEPL